MYKGYLIIIGLLVAFGIIGYFLFMNPDASNLKKVENSVLPTASPSGTINPTTTNTMDGQLKIEDIKVGTGDEAVAGKKVTVNYSGTLTDGTKFDSSYDRGVPFSFNLGEGDVIQGWDLGVAGMKVGGKRKLTIPSDLGYGARGAGDVIPPNATLVFEVELLDVK